MTTINDLWRDMSTAPRDQADLIVTSAMREAGAALLGDPELSFSHEEMAAAVYVAMTFARIRGERHSLRPNKKARNSKERR